MESDTIFHWLLEYVFVFLNSEYQNIPRNKTMKFWPTFLFTFLRDVIFEMLQNCVHDEICKERGKHGSNVFLKHGKTSNSESESLGKLDNAFCAFLDIHKINILKNSVV